MQKSTAIIILSVLLLVSLGTAIAYRVRIREFAEDIMRERLPEETVFTPPLGQPLPAATSSAASALPAAAKKEPPPPVLSTALSTTAVNLAVPFTSQAPHQIWELPFKEACEEASMLMLDAYYKKKTFTPDSATTDIEALVEWEKKTFGYYEDTTAEEVVQTLRNYFNYEKAGIDRDASAENIKKYLRAGTPVIIPAAGRLLPNPNFRQPGPLYHMLVVKGITEGGNFITNDPGTRKGHNFVYTPEALVEAIHDWNSGDVYDGKKVLIIAQ